MRSRHGFTLIEVMIASAIAGMLAIAIAGMLGHSMKMMGQVERRMTVVELRDYIVTNTGCARTLDTYIATNGDSSACRPPSKRAIVRRRDGSTLLSDTQESRWGRFELRASCEGTRKIYVEYRDVADKQNPGWKGLLRGGGAVCDESERVENAGWGRDEYVPSAQTPDLSPQAKTASEFAYAIGGMVSTGAMCRPARKFSAGFANCPSELYVTGMEMHCPSGSAIHTTRKTDGGVFGVCCGPGGTVSISCSRRYDVRTGEAVMSPDRPFQSMTKDSSFERGGMAKLPDTCRGPDANITYSKFSGQASLCVGEPREAIVSCPAASRLGKLIVAGNRVGGECCSVSGKVELKCVKPPPDPPVFVPPSLPPLDLRSESTVATAALPPIPKAESTTVAQAVTPTTAPTPAPKKQQVFVHPQTSAYTTMAPPKASDGVSGPLGAAIRLRR